MITNEDLAELMIPEDESQIEEFEIINEITIIRTKNNLSWMKLLKLALKHAPQETKAIMADITKHDMEISNLSKKLTEKRTFGGEE